MSASKTHRFGEMKRLATLPQRQTTARRNMDDFPTYRALGWFSVWIALRRASSRRGPLSFAASITVSPLLLRMVRSAPCSMKSGMASSSTVVKIGVSPSLLRAFTSAPSFNNSFSTSARNVSCKGVFPLLSRALTSAPASTKILAHSAR